MLFSVRPSEPLSVAVKLSMLLCGRGLGLSGTIRSRVTVFPAGTVMGNEDCGRRCRVVAGGTFEIQADGAVAGEVVGDLDAHRHEAAARGFREQGGDVDVGVGLRIEDLVDHRFLRGGGRRREWLTEGGGAWRRKMGFRIRNQADTSTLGVAVALEWHLGEQVADDVIGGAAFDAGVVVEHNAVAQHGGGDGFDILEAGIRSLLHQGAGLGAGGEGERGARAGTVADAAGGGGLAGMGGVDQAGDVVGHHVRQVDAAGQL